MKVIDAANWPRKSQFEFFRFLPAPHFSVTSNLDFLELSAMDEFYSIEQSKQRAG